MRRIDENGCTRFMIGGQEVSKEEYEEEMWRDIWSEHITLEGFEVEDDAPWNLLRCIIELALEGPLPKGINDEFVEALTPLANYYKDRICKAVQDEPLDFHIEA